MSDTEKKTDQIAINSNNTFSTHFLDDKENVTLQRSCTGHVSYRALAARL